MKKKQTGQLFSQRTHSQVSPDDAVVGAPLSDAAAVRGPAHAHRAAPPVVLQADVRFQDRCKNRMGDFLCLQDRRFVRTNFINREGNGGSG